MTQSPLHIRAGGRIVAYLLPSNSEPGVFHCCTPRWCDCLGWQFKHRCRHQRQVAEYVAAVRNPQPAADVLVGLEQLLWQRNARAYDRIFREG